MKKLLLLLIIPFLSFGQDLTYVPDDGFEQKLINIGYDDVMDDYVLTENLNTVVSLSVTWSNISDLTGIEGFSNLEYLICYSNNITNLDLSNNLNLTLVSCNNNNLEELNISQNIQLEFLDCYDNNLEELDVSQNTQLTHLWCYNNFLSCIQVFDVNYAEENAFSDTFAPEFQKDNDAIWSLDCNYETSIQEVLSSKDLLKIIDILGRETTNKGFNIEIYNDSSVEKKYLIK